MNRTGEGLRPGHQGEPKASGRLASLARLVPPSLLRAARRAAAILVECHRAHVRLNELRLAPDRYLLRPDEAPDSYAEFLFRTRANLRHEPPARKR